MYNLRLATVGTHFQTLVVHFFNIYMEPKNFHQTMTVCQWLHAENLAGVGPVRTCTAQPISSCVTMLLCFIT